MTFPVRLGLAWAVVAAMTTPAYLLSRRWEEPRWIEWTAVAVVGAVLGVALARRRELWPGVRWLVILVGLAGALVLVWLVAFVVDLLTRDWQ